MNWLVIGGGISGVAAAKLLNKSGHQVRISDARPLKPDLKQELEKLGIDVCDSGHSLNHLKDVSQVLLSPGLPNNHELICAANSRGLPLLSEIDLALADYQETLFGVTGTNGKSTVCAMIAHLIGKLGEPVALVGNIGLPPSALRLDGKLPPFVVAEVSSYQLEQSKKFRAKIAVFTNLSPDHLGRHGTRQAYFSAKWSMIENLQPDGVCIFGPEVIKEARQYGYETPASQLSFTNKKPSAGEFALINGNLYIEDSSLISLAPAKLIFPHNQLNAAFAITAVSRGLGFPAGALPPLLADFKSLPHRCEILGTWNGHLVIEDSKATNLDSVHVALNGVKKDAYLLLGGQPKGELYQSLILQNQKIKKAFLFGEAAPQIAADLENKVPHESFSSLIEAVNRLKDAMQASPTMVLFSPGCASFDEFENFSVRGDAFQKHVRPFLD